jgi:hypothetical protein
MVEAIPRPGSKAFPGGLSEHDADHGKARKGKALEVARQAAICR